MKRSFACVLLLMLIVVGCEPASDRYFFLREYPDLRLVDPYDNIYPEQRFIRPTNEYGVLTFVVRSGVAKLVNNDTGEPYTGFIRTYYDDLYNLEAYFEGGWIQRLRVWHPNRVLAMDRNLVDGTGSAWDSQNRLAVNWEKGELQVRNPQTGALLRLIQGSTIWYFDSEGDLDWYQIQSDTAITEYYADETPRYRYPVGRFGGRTGAVTRWYRDGSLQLEGFYTNGKESGVWKEYDREGQVIRTKDYDTAE